MTLSSNQPAKNICYTAHANSGVLMNNKVIDGWNYNKIHFSWKPSRDPIGRVNDGDSFKVKVPDSSTMQVKEDWTTADMPKLDTGKFDGAVGPIHVEGAEPGDAIEVTISDIITGSWGWTSIQPDFGFIKKRFQNRLVIWNIKDGFAQTKGDFLKGVRVVVKPFLGVIGVAPSEGEFGMIPPQYFGGNMDNHLLVKGARLYLPVQQKGALLSVSDPHASQGDGEVCGTAIETSAEVTLNVKVHKNAKMTYPRAFSPYVDNEEKIVAMGIAPDLKEAAQLALDNMFDELNMYDFTEEESYALMSVVGDLRISEIVDEPNFVVSATIAKRYTRR